MNTHISLELMDFNTRMKVETFNIVLKDAYAISKNVKHFVFYVDKPDVFHYTPGQFITIYFPFQDKILHRSYSIANAPNAENIIELAAAYVDNGPGSTLLFGLEPNTSIQARGPFGRLILKDPLPKRYVFVSTSTGITPYRAMLSELKKIVTQADVEILFIQGVQKREDLIYHSEFLQFAEHEKVRYQVCFSREQDVQAENEHLGYVQTLFEKEKLHPEQDIVYLCGNPKMVDESFQWLQAQAFTTQRIVREKYISGA